MKPYLQSVHHLITAHNQQQTQFIKLKSNDIVHVTPVVLSVDGMQLKPGCQRDSMTNELVGTTEKIDILRIVSKILNLIPYYS